MGTRPCGSQERSLQVHARYTRQAVRRQRPRERERFAIGGGRRRDKGGLEGDDPARRERLRRTAIVLAVGSEEVDPGDAVDVHVHKARHGRAMRPGRAPTNRDHRPVGDPHVSLDQRPAYERRLHPEPHEAPSPGGLDQVSLRSIRKSSGRGAANRYMTRDRTSTIVGASLAGAKAAETLRAEGFDGRVVVVGAENERPYERPPLSKEYLRGEAGREKVYVHAADFYAEREIELRLGRVVVSLTSRRTRWCSRMGSACATTACCSPPAPSHTGSRSKARISTGCSTCAASRTQTSCGSGWTPAVPWWSSGAGGSARRWRPRLASEASTSPSSITGKSCWNASSART